MWARPILMKLVPPINEVENTNDFKLETATQKMLNAFEKMSHSVSAEKAWELSADLSTDILNVLTNVPPPCELHFCSVQSNMGKMIYELVQTEFRTASKVTELPNPDEEGCSFDYSELCPAGWVNMGDGRKCNAPFTYTGNCNKVEDLSDMTPLEKYSFAKKCEAAWPCLNQCEQNFQSGACSAVVLMLHRRSNCPENWELLSNGVCAADNKYSGPCVRKKSFLNFESYEKKKWGEICNVRWPCLERDIEFHLQLCPLGWTETETSDCIAPSTYLGPCATVQPVGKMTEKEKKKLEQLCKLTWPTEEMQLLDFNRPCPLGWKESVKHHALNACALIVSWTIALPLHTMMVILLKDLNRKKNKSRKASMFTQLPFLGPCDKKISLANMSPIQKYNFMRRCFVTWPYKESDERDYERDCPLDWALEDSKMGLCVAPSTYNGRCSLRVSFKGFTNEQKSFWGHRCEAPFELKAFSAIKRETKIEQSNWNLTAEKHERELNKSKGPIGYGEEYGGKVLEANGTNQIRIKNFGQGTVYSPSKPLQTDSLPPNSQSRSASSALETQKYIDELEGFDHGTNNSRIHTILQDTMEQLRRQGSIGDVASFLELSNRWHTEIKQPQLCQGFHKLPKRSGIQRIARMLKYK
ncbi:cpw-wpc domain-containing protein [Cardiosporidium cionae]|uniref:Cpw-wpc domain-containing protein n=1 Tax=Cardiosporidium cionae TaxID=476202 RepID=A0ABQ7J5X2_9APIC|nr:cpw-wpc domain-containing protein [Cardiosporidium cionae]|eukprot:KAF8819387.1 cpw-wpc domain-containing protein [Cardiosporidium cionae]